MVWRHGRPSIAQHMFNLMRLALLLHVSYRDAVLQNSLSPHTAAHPLLHSLTCGASSCIAVYYYLRHPIDDADDARRWPRPKLQAIGSLTHDAERVETPFTLSDVVLFIGTLSLPCTQTYPVPPRPHEITSYGVLLAPPAGKQQNGILPRQRTTVPNDEPRNFLFSLLLYNP